MLINRQLSKLTKYHMHMIIYDYVNIRSYIYINICKERFLGNHKTIFRGENFLGGRGKIARKFLLHKNMHTIRSTIHIHKKNITMILKTVIFLCKTISIY